MNGNITAIFDAIKVEIASTLSNLSSNLAGIYAGIFWLFYSDGTVINPPCFAINNMDNIDDNKWSPPDWAIDIVDDVYDAVSPLYEKLTLEMKGAPDSHWEDLVNYQYSFYCDLCKQLNEQHSEGKPVFGRLDITSEFFVGILEEREGEECFNHLISSSIGKDKAVSLGIIN